MSHSYPLKYDLPDMDSIPELPADDPDRHRLTKKTEINKYVFIEVLRRTANVAEACRVIGISRDLAYRWSRNETMEVTINTGERLLFSQAWESAIEDGVDGLEAVAFHRATHGIDEPVIHQGQLMYRRQPLTKAELTRASEHDLEVVGELERDENGDPIPLTVRKPSDRMLEILLKAHRPNKYRENVEVKHSIEGGVMVIPAEPTDWEAEAANQQKEHRSGEAPKPAIEGECEEIS